MAAPVIVRVRVAPGGTDKYGDPIVGTQDRTPIEGASVAPRESSESDDRGRVGVIVGLTLIAPYDTDLAFTDQVEVDGVLYDIEGEPGWWRNHFTGWEAGLTAALRRAEG